MIPFKFFIINQATELCDNARVPPPWEAAASHLAPPRPFPGCTPCAGQPRPCAPAHPPAHPRRNPPGIPEHPPAFPRAAPESAPWAPGAGRCPWCWRRAARSPRRCPRFGSAPVRRCPPHIPPPGPDPRCGGGSEERSLGAAVRDRRVKPPGARSPFSPRRCCPEQALSSAASVVLVPSAPSTLPHVFGERTGL